MDSSAAKAQSHRAPLAPCVKTLTTQVPEYHCELGRFEHGLNCAAQFRPGSTPMATMTICSKLQLARARNPGCDRAQASPAVRRTGFVHERGARLCCLEVLGGIETRDFIKKIRRLGALQLEWPLLTPVGPPSSWEIARSILAMRRSNMCSEAVEYIGTASPRLGL